MIKLQSHIKFQYAIMKLKVVKCYVKMKMIKVKQIVLKIEPKILGYC